MSQEIFVIDDFHPFPEHVREHALCQNFYDWVGPDGQEYKRICITEVPGLRAMVEGLLGPCDWLGMGYRLNYAGEPPNQSIHSDMGWGTHALVLYLTEGPSGTAFWQHRETKAHRIEPGDTQLYEQVRNDWEIEDKWELRQYIGMKFNRALIYESALFHSRYPFHAFGTDRETGRLIAVAFFSPRGSHDSPSNQE